jgi:hypothetical protein
MSIHLEAFSASVISTDARKPKCPARGGPTHRLPVQRDAGPGRESGHSRLEELTPTDDEELRALWQRTAEAALKDLGWHGATVPVPAQFLLLVT